MSAFGRALAATANSSYGRILDVPPRAGAKDWRPLPWDSEQFGFSAARLEFSSETGGYQAACFAYAGRLMNALDDCRAASVRHVTARADASNLALIHTLEGAGFELIDGIQTLTMDLAKPPPLAEKGAATDVKVRLFESADRAQVIGIARSAYVHDRFHNDSALPSGVAARVHATWIENCCNGEMADAVFVVEESMATCAAILGYATCKIETARSAVVIGHVATAAWARRRGVAAAATNAAVAWSRERGAGAVEIGTQLSNIPALRLYVKLGFGPVSVAFTFRRVL